MAPASNTRSSFSRNVSRNVLRRTLGSAAQIASVLLCTSFLFGTGACGNAGGATAGPGGSGGVGLGGTCNDNAKCRTGLDCVGGKCTTSGSSTNGSPCNAGVECSSGQCGPQRTCVPAGEGEAGANCGGDADCKKGFRCAFDGTSFFPACVPEGKTDLAGECTSTKDCLQGLYCDAGKCDNVLLPADASPKGIPPYVPSKTKLPWPGATCEVPVKGTITSLFKVPRDSDKPHDDFYKLPWPNDAARKKATGKVSYANHPHDPNPPMGFDAVKLYLDQLEAEPFGASQTMYFRFDGEFEFGTVDPSGADPQTRFVDVTEGPRFGQQKGLALYVTNGRNKYICNNYLAIRPNRGDALKPGTYAVILKKGIKGKDGSFVKGDADFAALVKAEAPSDAALKDAWDAYKPMRDYLTKMTIKSEDVINGIVFTVGDPHKTSKRLRTSVRAATAPTVGAWVKCDTGVKSPCPQAEDKRGCGAAHPDFDEYHTLVDLPIFQQGTAPYLTTKDGGGMDNSGDASSPITAVRTEKVCMAVTIPKGAAPAAGWPVAIYAHGTGGSFRSHAIDGSAKILSKIDVAGASMGYAVIGIDQVSHGPRRASSTIHPNDLFFNFANPAAARYNAQQGAADQHALVRLAETLTVDTVKLDPTKMVYWGHSQGATEGAIFLAYDTNVVGAVLSGEGAGLIDALTTKTKPVNIKDVMWVALSESSSKSVDGWHPVLSLLQAWADPADPLHYAAQDSSVPTATAGVNFGRNIFQPFGKDDTFTPWETQIHYAFAGGLIFVGPEVDARGLKSEPVANGNVTVGTGKFTAAFRQYAPISGRDGHFVAFDVDGAKSDLGKFLARSTRGETPKVPE